MTTFTTEDRELVEKEPIPFYGFYHLTDPSTKDKKALLHPILKKIKVDKSMAQYSKVIAPQL
jgi:hypothetical protein